IRMVAASGPFALTGIPADIATNAVTLSYGQSFFFGANFTPDKLGLTRGFLQISSNDPAQTLAKASLVGTGIDASPYPQWGSDFVAIGSQDQPSAPVLRTVSDASGHYSFFLPPTARYHEAIYDPVMGLIAHSYGQTAPSGGS